MASGVCFGPLAVIKVWHPVLYTWSKLPQKSLSGLAGLTLSLSLSPAGRCPLSFGFYLCLFNLFSGFGE